MMNILVVDDHILFREGLVSMLYNQPDLTIVGEAGSVTEAVSKAHELKPDLILMDFSLPDGTGPDAARMILAEQPKINIVFLTVHDADSHLLAAIRTGAKGYLLKNMHFSKLVASIRAIEHNEPAITPQMTLRLMEELSHPSPQPGTETSGIADLNAREIAILEELAVGASNQEIAEHLYISVATVKNYIHKIFLKLGLKNRQEASRFARQHNFRNLNRQY